MCGDLFGVEEGKWEVVDWGVEFGEGKNEEDV